MEYHISLCFFVSVFFWAFSFVVVGLFYDDWISPEMCNIEAPAARFMLVNFFMISSYVWFFSDAGFTQNVKRDF